jgi:hypothetical protein
MAILELPRRLCSNATTEELIGHIKHHYPNLGPALYQIIERLEEQIDNEQTIKDLETTIEMSKTESECPHCGSKISFELKS